MEYLIGVGLAVVVCAFAMLAGFDRDRVFYPTLLTVIATYYILFAVMGRLVVAALAGHGVFDFFHRMIIQNPGVPTWWPGFCLSFDILAGGFLALLLMRRSGFALTT